MKFSESRILNLVYINWLPRSLSNFVFTGWPAQKVRANLCCSWSCQCCVNQLLGHYWHHCQPRSFKSVAHYPDQSLPRTKKTKVCLLLGRVFYSYTVSGSLRTRILSFFSLLWVQVEDWTQALIYDKHLLSCCLLSRSLSVIVPFYLSGKPDTFPNHTHKPLFSLCTTIYTV